VATAGAGLDPASIAALRRKVAWRIVPLLILIDSNFRHWTGFSEHFRGAVFKHPQ